METAFVSEICRDFVFKKKQSNFSKRGLCGVIDPFKRTTYSQSGDSFSGSVTLACCSNSSRNLGNRREEKENPRWASAETKEKWVAAVARAAKECQGCPLVGEQAGCCPPAGADCSTAPLTRSAPRSWAHEHSGRCALADVKTNRKVKMYPDAARREETRGEKTNESRCWWKGG